MRIAVDHGVRAARNVVHGYRFRIQPPGHECLVRRCHRQLRDIERRLLPAPGEDVGQDLVRCVEADRRHRRVGSGVQREGANSVDSGDVHDPDRVGWLDRGRGKGDQTFPPDVRPCGSHRRGSAFVHRAMLTVSGRVPRRFHTCSASSARAPSRLAHDCIAPAAIGVRDGHGRSGPGDGRGGQEAGGGLGLRLARLGPERQDRDDALAVLEAYRPRYATVAELAGLGDAFAAAGELEVVERLPGHGDDRLLRRLGPGRPRPSTSR